MGNVLPTDDRRVECVVSGLPPLGEQLAVDATLVSPLTGKGDPCPKAHLKDGVALAEARKAKERRYPELATGRRCKLVVVGMEVGGRWEETAYEFLVELAKEKAQEAPKLLEGSATHAWLRQWVSLLFKADMNSLASTLLYGTASKTELWNEATPPLGAVLSARAEPPQHSRRGPR